MRDSGMKEKGQLEKWSPGNGVKSKMRADWLIQPCLTRRDRVRDRKNRVRARVREIYS
jgi:hypothetical protein